MYLTELGSVRAEVHVSASSSMSETEKSTPRLQLVMCYLDECTVMHAALTQCLLEELGLLFHVVAFPKGKPVKLLDLHSKDVKERFGC